MGEGDGLDGSLDAAARKNSKNSWPVLVGNPSVEWLTISVCYVFGEVEPDRKSARICFGVIVRNLRQPCGARKPRCDRR